MRRREGGGFDAYLGSITGFPSLLITGMLWLYTRQRQDQKIVSIVFRKIKILPFGSR